MRAGHQLLTLEIAGKGADKLTNEAGAHRIQRVSPTETRGRVHSSTVTVAVMNEQEASDVKYTKRSDNDFKTDWFNGTIGAGGQNHQKTACCARITHIPTGIIRTAQTRSRQNSLKNAMEAINADLDKAAHLYTNKKENDTRRKQIGTGERSDKRRTIRFQDDMVIDHITGKRTTAKEYMKGNMDKIW